MYSTYLLLSAAHFLLLYKSVKILVGRRSGDVWLLKHRAFKLGSRVHDPEEVKQKTQDFHPGNRCSCPEEVKQKTQDFHVFMSQEAGIISQTTIFYLIPTNQFGFDINY